MFTPKWKKEAHNLYKGSKKFLNYKRDLLKADRIDEIESRRKDLKDAWKSGDKEKTAEAGKQLQATCEGALPSFKGNNALAENVEVFFVAIVIALGLRAYYVQPFRIPTGSMQPTLNGIVGTYKSSDEWPSMPQRMAEKATHGRTYFSLKLDQPKTLRATNPIEQVSFFHFFTSTKIHFTDGTSLSYPGPKASLLTDFKFGLICGFASPSNAAEYCRAHNLDLNSLPKLLNASNQVEAYCLNKTLPSGTLAEGYLDTGDLILVDKVSYHFRRPKNGEVFVFDTREISGIRNEPGYGSHYIKRLIASPGDTLHMEVTRNLTGQPLVDPHGILFRNGEKVQDPGVLKVESQADQYRGYGSRALLAFADGPNHFNAQKMDNFPSTGKSEYWAMGDNSYNSKDSRDWGTVKEFNLVGPAAFSLWPFGSGHWGVIK